MSFRTSGPKRSGIYSKDSTKSFKCEICEIILFNFNCVNFPVGRVKSGTNIGDTDRYGYRDGDKFMEWSQV